MPSLLTLAVGRSSVSDLTPLLELKKLDYLLLTDLPVEDFSPLADLPALNYVQVDQGQLAAVEAACPGHSFRLTAEG